MVQQLNSNDQPNRTFKTSARIESSDHADAIESERERERSLDDTSFSTALVTKMNQFLTQLMSDTSPDSVSPTTPTGATGVSATANPLIGLGNITPGTPAGTEHSDSDKPIRLDGFQNPENRPNNGLL